MPYSLSWKNYLRRDGKCKDRLLWISELARSLLLILIVNLVFLLDRAKIRSIWLLPKLPEQPYHEDNLHWSSHDLLLRLLVHRTASYKSCRFFPKLHVMNVDSVKWSHYQIHHCQLDRNHSRSILLFLLLPFFQLFTDSIEEPSYHFWKLVWSLVRKVLWRVFLDCLLISWVKRGNLPE